MSFQPLAIRNYNPGDYEKFIKLWREDKNLNQAGQNLFVRILRKKVEWPDYSPEKELFIAEIERKIVGWMNVNPELRIKRVILSGFVHPWCRRQRIGCSLMEYALRRAEELKAEVTHVYVSQENNIARNFLLKVGFIPVRSFMELKVKLQEISSERFATSSTKFVHLKKGEENELAQIQNSCFTGNWGFNPNTAEKILSWLNLTETKLEDVIVAREGKEILGYCWTRMQFSEKHKSGQKKGRIHMVGVHPLYRGRGVGRKLVLAGLSYLKERGAEIVELTTDEENISACALYKSLDFSPVSKSLWYEKRILNKEDN